MTISFLSDITLIPIFLPYIRLEGAKRDNDFIYHEAEPASTALPEIKGTHFLY